MSSNNRQPIFPVIMVAAGVVMILGAIFWSMNMQPGGASIRAEPTSTGAAMQLIQTEAPPVEPSNAPRIPYPDVPRVTISDAKVALDGNQALFIDTRGEPYFSQEHIPGAIPLTADEIPSRLSELDPNQWIITYCT